MDLRKTVWMLTALLLLAGVCAGTGVRALAEEAYYSAPLRPSQYLRQVDVPEESALYTVTFYVSDMLWDTQTVTAGEAVDWTLVDGPQPPEGLWFEGWRAADSDVFWEDAAPVTQDMALAAVFSPSVPVMDAYAAGGGFALYGVWTERRALPSDPGNASPRTLTSFAAMDTLAVDEHGEWYFVPSALPNSESLHTLTEPYQFEQTPAAWGWQYDAQSAPGTIIVRDGRWYLQGFDPEIMMVPVLNITYATDVISYVVYCCDEDETTLLGTLFVPEGTALAPLLDPAQGRWMIPEARRESFTGWEAVDGASEPVRAPLQLKAKYLPLHTVSFHAGPEDAPLYTQMVPHGQPVDWTQLPPSVTGLPHLTGWRMYDVTDGTPGDVYVQGTPVTGPLRLVAAYVPKHKVSFFADENRTPLLHAQTVWEGEAIDWMAVPAVEGLTGWRIWDAESQTAGPLVREDMAVLQPLELIAAYQPRHTVSFYESLLDNTPLASVKVWDGHTVDWSLAPAVSREGASLKGWAVRRADTALQGVLFAPETPVHADLDLVALFEDLYTVAFVDAQGTPLAEYTVPGGGQVDVEAVVPPVREGLSFSHWEDARGNAFTSDTEVFASLRIQPVYEATVTFLDGETVLATRTVREGDVLGQFPVNPAPLQGYSFLDWDMDLYDVPITRDVTLRAVYAVDVTFQYGLQGEHTELRQVRVGDVVEPPDATVYGYTHHWTPSLSETPVEKPVLSRAVYALARYTVRFAYRTEENTVVYFATAQVSHGDTVSFPQTPQWTGYSFTGWDWPKDGKVTQDMTVFAYFEKDAQPTPSASPSPKTTPTKAPTASPARTAGRTAGGASGAAAPNASPTPEKRYTLHADDVPMTGIVSGSAGYGVE